VPTALAGVVAGLASLHDFRRQPQHARAQDAPQWNSGGANYLAPSDFAVIYDVAVPYAAGVDGSGRSIAVLGRSDIVAADISTFQGNFGLAVKAPQIIHNGAAPGLVADDETESDLDLEWSTAVAPGAAVKFVTSASTRTSDGIDLSAAYAVANNVADIISLSYGGCENAAEVAGGASPFYDQLWRQAAAQGISVFVSSGDAGAAGCDVGGETSAVGGAAVNALCSSPWSTCVGGNEFSADKGGAQSSFWSAGNSPLPTAQPTALSYIGEGAWNDSGTVAGGSGLWSSGGGTSLYYAKPAWQYATDVPVDGKRDVPDVALTASAAHDAYLVYSSDGHASPTLEAIGGTSASTPAMAGIAALLGQSQAQRLGNLNAVLYALSNLQAAGGAPVFHRITSGNNSVPGQAGFSASPSHPAYSQVSGLGSVDVGVLLAHWSDAPSTPTVGLVPSFVVLPAGASVGAAGLSVASTTAWTASPSAAWLGVTPTSGTGASGLSFTATANTGAARSATITAAGLVLTINQAAGASGTAPQLLASSSALSFGSVPVGTAAATQRLQIGNVGAAPLVLAGVALTGAQPGDYALAGDCASGLAIPAGASCHLDITFTPGANGTRAASLQVTSNDAASPVIVGLSGSGTTATGTVAVPVPLWAQAMLASGLWFALRRSRSAPRRGA
jgi:subtilase family serine protease